MAESRLFLVLLAGGQSTRARSSDSAAPKQFRDVGGRMVFLHGLEELAQAPGVVRVVVVTPEAWRPMVESGLGSAGLTVPWCLASAGEHRTASTWSALRALAGLPVEGRPGEGDLVAVHDAARPFATADLLARLAVAAVRAGGAVPGVPVPDTIVQDAGDRAQYLDRSSLLAVQTPQVFHWKPFQAAHAWAAGKGVEFTDDGGLLAEKGLHPEVVAGESGNWKVTTDADWRRAAAILESS